MRTLSNALREGDWSVVHKRFIDRRDSYGCCPICHDQFRDAPQVRRIRSAVRTLALGRPSRPVLAGFAQLLPRVPQGVPFQLRAVYLCQVVPALPLQKVRRCAETESRFAPAYGSVCGPFGFVRTVCGSYEKKPISDGARIYTQNCATLIAAVWRGYRSRVEYVLYAWAAMPPRGLLVWARRLRRQ